MFYLNVFLVFAILGYSYETIFRIFLHATQDYLLIGPWMPIYGFGMLNSELVNIFLNKFCLKGWKKIFFFFVLSFFLLTIIEEIGGLLVEFFFATSYWNYEYLPLHIGPYINVFVSLLWALFATLMEYVLIPILSPFLRKVSPIISYICLFLMILDHIYLLVTRILQ